MARNASSRIPVTYEAGENFTATIRPLKMPTPGAAPLVRLKLNFLTCGLGETGVRNQLHLQKPVSKSCEPIT